MLLLLFSRNDGTVIVPPEAPAIPVGGSGYPAPHGLMWKKKRFDQKVGDWVNDAARAYRELTEANPETQKKAAKIVRPFIKPKVKYALVPKPESVDWAALRRDLNRANALLALWAQQKADEEIRKEEELFMMMVA